MKHTVSLKENRIFRRLYAKGKSAVAPTMVLYCRKNGRRESRLGLTTGTKLGHAVVRNRVRRRLREIYRLQEDKLLPGYDIVVVARVRAVHSKYAVLERDFLLIPERRSHEDSPFGDDSVLPSLPLPPPPPYLPVHSHLLGLCHGGHRKVWRLEGGLAGGAPDPPVQPIP